MPVGRARFGVGEIIHHRLFEYRGVITDVDPVFSGTEEWYRTVARSRPPKAAPWYHVLVDGALHMTYVAEQNLEAVTDPSPVRHPLTIMHFSRFENGRYISRARHN